MNTENNKIIAEFMGLHLLVKLNLELKYDTDWNWLMEVVEKIEKVSNYDSGDRFGTHVIIKGRVCSIKSGNYGMKGKEYSKKLYFNNNYSGDTKIKAVYNACVEFIKWYNENSAKEN